MKRLNLNCDMVEGERLEVDFFSDGLMFKCVADSSIIQLSVDSSLELYYKLQEYFELRNEINETLNEE